MKQKILFMTVGTGYGKEGYKDLANGLYKSIKYNSPLKVVFFVTDKSMTTVNYLKELYESKENEQLDSYDIVKIDNPDDFNNCYGVISKEIGKYSDNNIVVDYTSGTKTMSVSIAVIAILNHYDLISITGNRGDLGVIITSTEENKNQNPYQVYDMMNFKSLKKHFNNNRFESAKLSLENIVALFDAQTKELLNDFITLYSEWDKFHHTIPKIDTKNELFSSMKKQLGSNFKSLNIIANTDHNFHNDYIVADMLNNAKRRFAEGRFDDATARLYRSLELIEQKILSDEYGLDTSNISIEKLKKYELNIEYISELQRKEQNSKIKLGLRDSYYLLYKLGNGIGEYYIQNDDIYVNMLSVRNKSILAHGEKPVLKEDYVQFEQLVYDIAKLFSPNIDVYLKETEFAKFNDI